MPASGKEHSLPLGSSNERKRVYREQRHRKALPETCLMFWVYILRCADGTYYTGHTDNLQKRVAEHHVGAFEGYTSRRKPVELVFSQMMPAREDAFFAEMRIKKWSKSKKEALIRGDWEAIRHLAKKPKRPGKDQCTFKPKRPVNSAEPARFSSRYAHPRCATRTERFFCRFSNDCLP